MVARHAAAGFRPEIQALRAIAVMTVVLFHLWPARIDSPRFRAVDLYPYLCDEEVCHFVVGGLITTKDANHLTSTFATTLAPFLLPTIQDLLAQREK